MRRISLTCSSLLAIVLLVPVPAAAQDYSTKPLASPIAFRRNSPPTEPKAFFAWIVAPHPEPRPGREAVLEHAYALIGASVKQRFQSERVTGLPVGDTTLAHLFDIGARLGSFGASQVVRALGATDGGAEPFPVPSEFDLRFEAPLFTLASNTGRWRVRFPYYYMVGMLSREPLNEGGTMTNVVTLSTLTAADSGAQSGASQATYLILSVESEDLGWFAGSWLARFGITPADTIPRLVPEATRSYRTFSPQDGLWKEMSVFKIPSGSLIVFYSGLPGTFQVNRPHYLDLLRSLQVR